MSHPMKHLMEPMMIGKVKIKNRFAMAPMAIGSNITQGQNSFSWLADFINSDLKVT